MKGVFYKYYPHQKINGTVLYAFEYFTKLYSTDKTIKFYIVDLDQEGRDLFITLFKDRYNVPNKIFDNIISIKRTQIFKLKLIKSLVLDIRTLQSIYPFLTGEVKCFSNEKHNNIKGTRHCNIEYFGSYDYQIYDHFCYLKLNFDIFKKINNEKTSKVFISSRVSPDQIDYSIFKTNKQLYKKRDNAIISNLFQEIDEVIYYHVLQDTNNRVIPEAFFYNKEVVLVEGCNIIDSTILRYNDIKQNGLINYTLTDEDIMIKEMIK